MYVFFQQLDFAVSGELRQYMYVVCKGVQCDLGPHCLQCDLGSPLQYSATWAPHCNTVRPGLPIVKHMLTQQLLNELRIDKPISDQWHACPSTHIQQDLH